MRDLNNYRNRGSYEHETDNGNKKGIERKNAYRAEKTAERKRTRIAHKHFRRRYVETEKRRQRAYKAERKQYERFVFAVFHEHIRERRPFRKD